MNSYAFFICLFVLIFNELLLGIQCSSESVTEITNSTPEPKIVGGSEVVDLEKFQYQVSVRRLNSHICGGSLISKKNVLTAAHCLLDTTNPPYLPHPPKQFSVGLGSLTLSRMLYTYGIEKYIVHEHFSKFTFQNDIAIIVMSIGADITSIIRPNMEPIALPTGPVRAGSVAVVSGWGRLLSGGYISDSLMAVNISIIDERICNTALVIFEGMICAGDWLHGGKDSCQGDSGGPLVYGNQLIGIVSWGYNCGLPQSPGVYTDVYYFLDWIKKNGSISNAVVEKFNLFGIMIIGILLSFVQK